MTTLRDPAPYWADCLSGKSVLITGGLGFIGSSLALQLVELGANVSVLDALIPEYGGNWFNVAFAEDRISATIGDIRDAALVSELVQDQDLIIHGAAQVSHVKSLADPFPDIDINIKGTAVLLEACRTHNPQATLIKLGTRGQYGQVSRLPVGEDTPVAPRGIYEFSSHASEQLMEIYHRIHGTRVVLLRLSNIYGPRAQMRHSRFGVANWFIRLAMDDRRIPVFGTGRIKRDFLYIDDCVEAILRLACCPSAIGEVFNIGNDHPSDFLELAQTVVEQAGSGRWGHEPFSPERAAQEPGDFVCSIEKIHAHTGWRPTTPLVEGVRQTIEFYREFGLYYWEPQLVAA